MSFPFNSIVEIAIFFYIIKWVYRKFIKGRDSDEISKNINSFVEAVKKEFEKTFKSNKDISYKTSTQDIYDEEDKRRKNESYENAVTLYKAGVITKEELKEYKQ